MTEPESGEHRFGERTFVGDRAGIPVIRGALSRQPPGS